MPRPHVPYRDQLAACLAALEECADEAVATIAAAAPEPVELADRPVVRQLLELRLLRKTANGLRSTHLGRMVEIVILRRGNSASTAV